MVSAWPAASYEDWRSTCDTLHAHTQVLGKLAAGLAPPEPQLQHAALRLTARGWGAAPVRRPGRAGRADPAPGRRRGDQGRAGRGPRPGRPGADRSHPAGSALDRAAG